MAKVQELEEFENKQKRKPLFISRVFAYLIDSILVLLLASLLSSPFINSDHMISLAKESSNILEKYQSQEISEKEYNVEISNLEYLMAKDTLLVNILYILVGVAYFVVYPLYRNGQTLGKKLFKMKIISSVGNLDTNQMIFRSFLANSILYKLITIIFIMFSSRDVYSLCINWFSYAQYIFIIVSIFMVVYGKEGLSIHDRIVHTKVVKVDQECYYERIQ